MPRPSLRTRSRKRETKRLPSGRAGVQYKSEVPGLPRCSRCGNLLGGVSNVSILGTSKLNAGQRRVQRPFGGQLCHRCLVESLRQAARTS